LQKDDCNNYRDSLAKGLYDKLFNWLVKRLNFTVLPAEKKKLGLNQAEFVKTTSNYFHVGLLDIFGFEIMKVNSFEQL